jgi:demethylmenaquinone methyltransferase/2-methoxy-6-polyprenyl-1,4-benzoquinol methylase
MRVLDVCVGSGQVAHAAIGIVGATGTVVALDASLGMLLETRKRLAIRSMQGLVEAIPVIDGFADFVTMGYALRHLADLRRAFSEFKRVLRPGGTLLMIEFARPRSRVAYHALKLYLYRIVPAIARLGSREAAIMMRYFWDTIENCVPPQTILDILNEVGFGRAVKGGQSDLLAEYTAQKPV